MSREKSRVGDKFGTGWSVVRLTLGGESFLLKSGIMCFSPGKGQNGGGGRHGEHPDRGRRCSRRRSGCNRRGGTWCRNLGKKRREGREKELVAFDRSPRNNKTYILYGGKTSTLRHVALFCWCRKSERREETSRDELNDDESASNPQNFARTFYDVGGSRVIDDKKKKDKKQLFDFQIFWHPGKKISRGRKS